MLVVDNHQTRYYVLPDRLQISNQLIHYQYLLQNSVKNETLLDSLRIASRELATATLGDFQKEVGNYSSLYISADGVLSLLPFESLLLGDKYLIETAEIANVPSLYLLPTLRERLQTDTLSLLAFADPKPENSLQPLPFSLKEVQWISALFKGEQCKLLTGAAAAKSFLFSPEASRFNLLHFATHSSIDHDDPLRSRTWLSPDTSGDSTNYLTLDDVMRLSLSADLVVLSSCESGGGRYQLGEGIEGFVRAFMYAGCRNVVVSLWDVEDFTSATFMKTFYQNLNHGYVSALRQAKLEMIKSPRLRYRHPYYWAPFVLVLGQ